jgi:hypothetical protein
MRITDRDEPFGGDGYACIIAGNYRVTALEKHWHLNPLSRGQILCLPPQPRLKDVRSAKTLAC